MKRLAVSYRNKEIHMSTLLNKVTTAKEVAESVDLKSMRDVILKVLISQKYSSKSNTLKDAILSAVADCTDQTVMMSCEHLSRHNLENVYVKLIPSNKARGYILASAKESIIDEIYLDVAAAVADGLSTDLKSHGDSIFSDTNINGMNATNMSDADIKRVANYIGRAVTRIADDFMRKTF
jgi:hypothetical protein